MALPQVGLEALIAGLRNFESGAKTILDSYDNIEKRAKGVEKSTGGLSSALSSLGSPLSALGGQFVGLGDSLLKVGAIAGGAALAGILALSGGIATFAISGIGQAKDLDQQIANIAATMGKTKEEIAPLKQEILDLSLNPNLTVNVTQAADAIQLLAQNGITMTQILGGAAESTVALANATGADFATAANIATSVMQQFGIDAKDIGTAIDGITGVTVSSKFEIGDYGLAISQAGGLAAGVGISLQDFNTVLAGTAVQFNSGSDAGTSFRALLARLANPTDEMITKMNEYGISLFDDNGKVRDLADVAGDLNSIFNGTATITETVGGATKKQAAAALVASKNIDSLRSSLSTNQKQLQLYNDQLALEIGYYGEGSPKVRSRQLQIERLNTTIGKQTGQLTDYEGAINAVDRAQERVITSTKELTDQEKANLAITIGGIDGQRTILGLAQMTEDQFRKLSGEVNKSGQASKAAATRVDTLSGAWEILQGIIQAIQIQVGDLFLPILRQVTSTLAGLATGNSAAIVAFFDSLITKGQELFTAFSKYGAGGLLAALGLEGGGLLFKKISELMVLIMGDAGTLADTLTNTLGTAFSFLSENLLPALTVGVQFVIDHFDEIKGALMGVGAVLAGGVFAAIVAGIASLVSPILLVVAGAALLGAAWAGNWGGIQEKTMAVWAAVQPAFMQIGEWLGVVLPAAGLILADFWTNILSPAISAFIDYLIGTVIPTYFELAGIITTTLFSAISGLATLWTGTLLPAIQEVWGFISTFLGPVFDNLSQRADLVIFTFRKFGTEAGFAIFGKQVVSVINQMIPGFSGLVTWLQTNIPIAIQTVTSFWNTYLLPAITSISNFITTTLIPAFTSIGTFLSTVLAIAIQTVSSMWTNTLLPATTGVWGFISNSLLPLFASISNVINAVLGLAITALAGIFQNILMPALTIAWNYFSTKILTQFNLVAGVVNTVLGVAIAGLSKLWSDTLLPAIKNVGDFIGATLQPALAAIGAVITDKVSPPAATLSDKILPSLKKAFDGILRIIKDVTGYFNGLASAIRNFTLPPILTPGSPTPLELALDGIGRAAIEAGQALAGMNIDTSTATLDKLLNLDRNMLSIANKIKIASSSTQDFVDTLDNVDEKKFDILRREMKGVFGDEQKRNTILNTLRSGTKGVNEQVDVFKSFLPSNLEKIGLGGANAGAVNNVIGHFLKAFQESEKKLKDMQHEAFIQAGRTAISIGSSLADIISSSADVLDNRVLTLQSLVNSGLAEVNFEGSIISATEAQRRLNQALLEQQAIQDDLLETQQNQAKLDFLNKQLDLLETIKKAGLDPKDILGGLELGLDASIPDIIAATNRLVTAMVNQVNEDLQIASPSKVMARAGKSTGLGFGLGMLASIPDVMKATQRMISAVPSMISAPALGGGTGAGSVSNTNFNMVVNTGATPQAVIGQYAIMQAMVG